MPPAGFEPVIPTGERPQTHDLDRAATGIGSYFSYTLLIKLYAGKAKEMVMKHLHYIDLSEYVMNQKKKLLRIGLHWLHWFKIF
jgi:hypothetical protein